MVLNWGRRIGGAIGLWPLSDRTAARLTNAQIKEADLTGEMMRPFREAPTRYWYVSGIVLRPELGGTRAIRVLLGDGALPLDLHRRDHIPFPTSSSRVFEERRLAAARAIWFLLLSKGSCYAGRCCAFRSLREP